MIVMNLEENELYDRPLTYRPLAYGGAVYYDHVRMDYYYIKDGIRYSADNSRSLRKGIHVKKVKVEKMKAHSQMRYEDLIRNIEVQSAEYSNSNARHIAKHPKLVEVADILEACSRGMQTETSYWQHSSSGYKALSTIPPTICFEDCMVANKFCEIVKSAYPDACAKQFIELEYGRLSMNDRPSNITHHTSWPTARGSLYIVTVVHIGNGVEFGIRSVTGPKVPEIFNSKTSIGRLELFVDYCRRTAAKKA